MHTEGAAPSYDIWGLGLILFKFRLFTAMRLFNSDEHEELDVKQLCKLVLWRGIEPAELRQRVFSKAGTVPSSKKRLGRAAGRRLPAARADAPSAIHR